MTRSGGTLNQVIRWGRGAWPHSTVASRQLTQGLTRRDNQPLIELRHVSKRFPGVLALNDVSFEIWPGEVLALVGENGAGKSTVVKVLSGAYQPDEGEILVADAVTTIADPHSAQAHGIITIYQETTLVSEFNAIQNIFLGRELTKTRRRSRGLFLDEVAMKDKARLLYAEFESDETDLYRPVGELGALKQKVVEVVKGLAFEATLLIMDEPTAPLTERERGILFGHIRQLTARGVAVLLVTHRLEELLQIADRAVVLRDGRFVATVEPRATGTRGLVQMMVGRDVESAVRTAAGPSESLEGVRDEEVLRVEGLSRAGVLEDISFSLDKGEILGVAGLAGSGRTELARALIGADRIDAGRIVRAGRAVRFGSPRDAIRNGITLVPEERKTQGVFAGLSVAENISVAAIRRILRLGFLLDVRREARIAEGYVDRLRIRTPSVRQEMRFLSGGNQQKVLIARCLMAQSNILILDEPTQGIDVGAKSDVYALVEDYARSGGAAVVVSSELGDLVRLSDRILVMREGSLAGEVVGGRGLRVSDDDYTLLEEEVLHLALGVSG